MKKRYWAILIFLVTLTITYFSGPIPDKPDYSNSLPEITSSLDKLELYVEKKEDSLPVRKDNEAHIIWNNDQKRKTEYSIIYLHGFAGSYMDGYPVNKDIAEDLGANIYMARWAGHGLKPEAALENFSGENAWFSAREALAIGKRLGDKVIIMSTSTGGTLAFKLAAEFPDQVYALVNLSPNVEDDQPGTFVLNSPWGYEIAKLISFGDMKKIEHEQEEARKYWDTIYPSKALVDLQVLVETTMLPETFQKITSPVLTLYYHRNFIEEDQHVEVSVYEDVYKLLGTPDSLKVLKPLRTPATHFIGSDIKSKDTEIVENAILEFFRENMKIKLDSLN
ncbi:alpha/beta hydrolase [Christiangramia sp. SM2212]|uniref:Alpha/beta fold hydrolase n=1 Tax=Christiangramia sediminicola TaxID=3073267 RepID=A0ABU1EUE3_9FLAO|nr:alpha/beta fold hydrolase [Christiangramia sp. SM2212]MDR5592000.1 alpha/beta fold hydrolase [Christiangramia sp. SM2212]